MQDNGNEQKNDNQAASGVDIRVIKPAPGVTSPEMKQIFKPKKG